METRLLKVFRAVARHGGLAGAALELHLTPSALSHALKSLETEIGCRLFDRSGNRLFLNQAGEQLLEGIEKPLRDLDRVAASIKDLARWGQGRLRIGAPAAACQYLVPSVLRELRKEFPRMHLIVETGDMPQLITNLRERRIDLAIGLGSEHPPDIEHRPIFEDELFFVFSPTHPWNDRRNPSAEDLARETLILSHRGSTTARAVVAYFRDHGWEPGATMEIASIQAIKELVRLNLGIAVMAPWAVEPELAKGALRMRPLGTKALKRQWVLAHLAGKPLSHGGERFYRLCRAQATGLRKGSKDLPG